MEHQLEDLQEVELVNLFAKVNQVMDSKQKMKDVMMAIQIMMMDAAPQ